MLNLITEIEFECVNGEIDRGLAGRIITALKAAEAKRDARIDPARVQDLIAAAEPVLAEAYAAAEVDNARLRKILKDAQGYLEKGLDKVAFNIIRATLEKDTK